jgi:hypothetical protein
VHTAKMMNPTVRAPTPVEPTSSIVVHAVGTPAPARAYRQVSDAQVLAACSCRAVEQARVLCDSAARQLHDGRVGAQ